MKSNAALKLLLPLLIVISGVFLRVYSLEDVYSEYDDVGVIALQKGFYGEDKIDINIGPFKSVVFDLEKIRNIENSLYYPLYMSKAWTYAPGQYMLLSFFRLESFSDPEKLYVARLMSSFSSILMICILTGFLFGSIRTIGDYWAAIIVLCLVCYSYNSILFAHHASPYSMYGLITLISGIILHAYCLKKISFGVMFNLILILGFFSYANILFLPAILYLFINDELVANSNTNLITKILDSIKSKFLICIPAFLALLILLIMIKSGEGVRGVMPRTINTFDDVLPALVGCLKNALLALRSIFHGFFYFEFVTLIFSGIFFVVFFIKFWVWALNRDRFAVAICIYFITWLVLHFFGKIVLDQTRHMLILFPILILILWRILVDFRLNQLHIAIQFFLYVGACIFSINAISSSISLINTKLDSKITFSELKDARPDLILTYGSTLSPLIMSKELGVPVRYLELKGTKKTLNNFEAYGKILLVSQDQTLDTYKLNKLKAEYPSLFMGRNIKVIKELNTEVYFPYNNYPVSSNPNSAFIYSLTRVR